MAIFQIKDNKVNRIKPTDFRLEKELQNLIEQNLDIFFNCRLIASELQYYRNLKRNSFVNQPHIC